MPFTGHLVKSFFQILGGTLSEADNVSEEGTQWEESIRQEEDLIFRAEVIFLEFLLKRDVICEFTSCHHLFLSMDLQGFAVLRGDLSKLQ